MAGGKAFHSSYRMDRRRKALGCSSPTKQYIARFRKKDCHIRPWQGCELPKSKCYQETASRSLVTLKRPRCGAILHNLLTILPIAVIVLALAAGFSYLFFTYYDLEQRTSSIEASLVQIRLEVASQADFRTQEINKVLDSQTKVNIDDHLARQQRSPSDYKCWCPPGEKGGKGETGAKGDRGPNGYPGWPGAIGIQGPKGQSGTDGKTGLKGDRVSYPLF
ncbi:uncharacterized protein [Watersipora subatra]|uniref:uncharacterized protein n=1 Tax=Watersipora subatra TaxID=2589382 RepID=UPI00355BA5A7